MEQRPPARPWPSRLTHIYLISPSQPTKGLLWLIILIFQLRKLMRFLQSHFPRVTKLISSRSET